MAKNVTSSDPRKSTIVAALKKVAGGGTKVTDVKEIGKDQFSGHVLAPHPEKKGFKSLGTHTVTLGATVAVKTQEEMIAPAGKVIPLPKKVNPLDALIEKARAAGLTAPVKKEAKKDPTIPTPKVVDVPNDKRKPKAKAKAEAAPKAKAEKKDKAPRVSVAGTIREMISKGLTNEQIFEDLKKKGVLDDSKKHYPGWYRSQMQRAKKAEKAAAK